jgi:hypothetical protein
MAASLISPSRFYRDARAACSSHSEVLGILVALDTPVLSIRTSPLGRGEMADEGYTIKDRIAILADTISAQFTGIVTQLDKIEAKLDGKASNERVASLEKQMVDLELRNEKRLTVLESSRYDTAEFSKRQMAWAAMAIASFVGILGYVIQLATSGGMH